MENHNSKNDTYEVLQGFIAVMLSSNEVFLTSDRYLYELFYIVITCDQTFFLNI